MGRATTDATTGSARRARRLGRLALSALAGLVLALGHPPFAAPWFALGGLVLGIALLLPAGGWRAGFAAGWAFGAGYFALTLHWIVEPFLVDPVRHGWMAPFALVLLAGGLALFWGVAGAVAAAMGCGPVAKALAFTAALAAMELLRAFVFTGFPWALVGSIWLDTPLAQAAALIGPHALGLLTVLGAGLFAALVPGRPLAALLSLGLPLGVLAALGALRPPPPSADPAAPVVRLVQPNAEQHLKWQADMIPVFFERQIALTAEAPPVDLVIWPESAIAYALSAAGPELWRISTAAGGAPVILGVVRRTEAGPKNALAVLGDQGLPTAIYDKAHLVPFGEYIPFGALAERLGLSGLAAGSGGGYAPGPGPALIEVDGLGTVLPLICYEAIFPHFGRGLTAQADWMVQVTNDAWFGEFAGPQQHLAIARMRAIERGLPLVRAANTGISAVIDSRGAVVEALPLGLAGKIDVALPRRGAVTPYVRYGEVPFLLLLLGVLAGAALFGRRQPD